MNKYFRDFFNDYKKFLKMSYFLNLCGISSSNFSNYLNGDNSAISNDKILELFNCILEEVSHIFD